MIKFLCVFHHFCLPINLFKLFKKIFCCIQLIMSDFCPIFLCVFFFGVVFTTFSVSFNLLVFLSPCDSQALIYKSAGLGQSKNRWAGQARLQPSLNIANIIKNGEDYYKFESRYSLLVLFKLLVSFLLNVEGFGLLLDQFL